MAENQRQAHPGDALVKGDIITREELDHAKAREKESGVPWYRSLLQVGKVTLDMVDQGLRTEIHVPGMGGGNKKSKDQATLGAALLDIKAITKAQLDDALAEQKSTGRFLGEILTSRGLVTARTIKVALAKQSGLEYAELEETPSYQHALDSVPESVALKYQMIPIQLEGDRLTCLINNPQLRNSIGDLGVILGKRIHPMMTTCDDIKAEIRARYKGKSYVAARKGSAPEEPALTVKKDLRPDASSKAKRGKKTAANEEKAAVATVQEPKEKRRFEEIAKEAQGAPVIKLVSTIIEGAINSGATDVHMDPQEPEMRVRYRIDGILHDVMSIAPEIEAAVISRLKIMAELDITETRHPQDGHIRIETKAGEYDVRVATLPTYLGERIVLRLLDQSTVLAGIKDLGLEPEDEKTLTKAIGQPYGMVLVTGPTGSGKTTTLYAALNQKNVLTDSIVTIEDPVEYQLSGINQVQVDPDIDVTFASTLRASLRQDIDVLLVGEIRDADTARIAIRAAMTGHLVFSTLHTNDAPEAISTLRNMQVPSYLIASALTTIVAQRLVRKICPDCKEAYVPPKPLLKSLHLPETTKKLYRGKGCDTCYHTGNKGRTGIFEIIAITPDIRKMIAADAPIEAITKAAKLKTMADRCRQKVKDGVVTAEEFLRVIRT